MNTYKHFNLRQTTMITLRLRLCLTIVTLVRVRISADTLEQCNELITASTFSCVDSQDTPISQYAVPSPVCMSNQITLLTQAATRNDEALVKEMKDDVNNMLKAFDDQGIETVAILLSKFETKCRKQYLIHELNQSGKNPFLIACCAKKKDLVELLLSCYDTPKEKQQAIEGAHALNWACRSGSKDLVELLLSCYDTQNEKQQAIEGAHALHWACRSGSKDLVELLFSCYNTQKEKQQAIERTAALQEACVSGSKDLVELLLSCYDTQKEKQQAIKRVDWLGMNALHTACWSGSKDLVELLLSCYDTQKEKQQAIEGAHALHSACRSASKDLVELLLSCYDTQKEKQQAIEGAHALHSACRSGSKDLVELLLSCYDTQKEKQQAIERVDRVDRNALSRACERGNKEVVELLLSSYDTQNEKQQAIEGAHALHSACRSGSKELVELLLSCYDTQKEKQQAIERVDRVDRNALSRACERGNKEVVELLLSCYDTQNEKQQAIGGAHALHWACKSGSKDLVELLLSCYYTQKEKQQAIERLDRLDRNALHWACCSGSKGVVELLLSCYDAQKEKQQAIERTNERNRNALHLACSSGSTKLVEVLLAVCDPDQLVPFITKQDNDGRSCLFGSNGLSDAAPPTIIKSLEAACDLYELEGYILTVDKTGSSPVHCACEHKLQESLRYFLVCLSKHDHCQADRALKATNKRGDSPLDLLTRWERTSSTEAFLQNVYSCTTEFFMNPRAPGSALLYVNTINRPGWEVELVLVHSLLNRMNIKIVHEFQNARAEDFIDYVRNLAHKDDLGSSVWLILMSHGERDSVLQFGDHTELSLQQLIDALAAIPALEDTPKVILSLACRVTGNEDNMEEPFHLRGDNFLVVQTTGYAASSVCGRNLEQFAECVNECAGLRILLLNVLQDACVRTTQASKREKRKQNLELRVHLSKNLYITIKNN